MSCAIGLRYAVFTDLPTRGWQAFPCYRAVGVVNSLPGLLAGVLTSPWSLTQQSWRCTLTFASLGYVGSVWGAFGETSSAQNVCETLLEG